MTYVKTYLPTLKTHVVNLKRDAKDLSRDLQRLEVRGKLGSKTLQKDQNWLGWSYARTVNSLKYFKVPITLNFFFSYLKLHLIKITFAKKFCDLNQPIFLEFF